MLLRSTQPTQIQVNVKFSWRTLESWKGKIREVFLFRLNTIEVLLHVDLLLRSQTDDFILQGYTLETIKNCNISLKILLILSANQSQNCWCIFITIYLYRIMNLWCWFHLYYSIQLQSLWYITFFMTFIHKHSCNILSFAKYISLVFLLFFFAYIKRKLKK